MKKINQMSKVCTLCFIALLAVACQKNQLMSDESISKLKTALSDRFFTDEKARPCAVYYSNTSANPALSKECDIWSSGFYKVLQQDGVISLSVTIDQFRDPVLWKTLTEKK